MDEMTSFSSLFAPEADQLQPESNNTFWKVMLVDDEPDIHAVLRLALQDLAVEGRPLLLLDASSMEEAKTQLSENPDIALILLDVVMETDHAGLELVRYIRQELDNKTIQIVLVTGQPGYAPQQEVITDYEINGYRLKSELTADKIFVSVYAALRTYHIMRNSDWQIQQLKAQEEILQSQHEELFMNEEALREQNNELLVTQENLRVQIKEYESSQAHRLLAEEALLESEKLHRSILQTAMDGFLLVNPEGCLLEVSETYCRMSGYSERELLEMKISDLEVIESVDETASRIRKIKTHGESRFESRQRRKDGSIFDVEISAQFRPVDGGQIITFLRDITERKQIEKTQLFLAQACRGAMEDEPFFNALARYIAQSLDMDFVCIDRVDGDKLNARTLAMWCDGNFKENVTYALKDTPCGDTVGKKICYFPSEVCRLFPSDQMLQDLHAESYAGVTLWNRSNQTIGLIAIIGRKTLTNRSLVESVLKLVAVRAASELEWLVSEEMRNKLEAQLLQAQKIEAIGRLAGGVAHDFNNMLTIILGHTQLGLMDMDASHPLYEKLTTIQSAANRSSDLTRQLLAFARKQTIAPQILNLNEAVSSMLKMLQRLISEGINLIWQPCPNLWPVNIDPSQIDQILANLCVNARDAISGVGMITINTENCSFDDAYSAVHAHVSAGQYVCISVSDDGCGMDTETLGRIFEPFFTTKNIGEGTGLGLATVYGIVRQNNGFIDVSSKPGTGTAFRIYLPRYLGKGGTIQTADSALPVLSGHETILLVEDEAAILSMTTMVLEKLGFRVLPANGPGEAIKKAREYPGEIHLLMTDVIMPEMNGRDLAKNLLPLYPNMKRLFMSGYTADVIAHHGVLDKGVHFIQKPFSLTGLAAKVREVLDGI